MKIDDLIEKLNAHRCIHGNVEVVLEEQSARQLLFRDPSVQHKTVWGDPIRHRNYAYDPSIADDSSQSVIVIKI